MDFRCKIKRVYEEPTGEDGYRMLIDRIWPRGVKKDEAMLDEWNKDIAPSDKLRKWFSHREERFDEFVSRYKEELNKKNNEILHILEVSQKKDVTLLYAARDQKINHAVVLLNYLKKAHETS